MEEQKKEEMAREKEAKQFYRDVKSQSSTSEDDQDVEEAHLAKKRRH
jgi:hypothetical protein